MAIRIVAEHGQDDVGNHLLEFVNEGRSIVLAAFYLSELAFPDTCQLGTFEQFLMDKPYEFDARGRGG